MKKLFIAAMALATIVSCSKDDAGGPALDSANKTVSITIKNSAVGTRAANVGEDVDAGITDKTDGKHEDKVASAAATELYVLFAAGDVVKEILPLSSKSETNDTHTNATVTKNYAVGNTSENAEGFTYTWHNVPWEIDNIAVVRTDAKKDPTYFGVNATVTSVQAFADLAQDEDANLTRELGEIVLFDNQPLHDTGRTHEVNGITYHYWSADLVVAPKFARFEINNIECENLGFYNTAANTDKTQYGWDELDVKSLTWEASNGKSYQIAATNGKIGTLYGQYEPAVGAVVKDPNTYKGSEDRAAGEADDLQAGTGKVWSWNVLPTKWEKMDVDLWAYAYDYVLADAGRDLTLNVVGLNGAEGEYAFTEGNIYKLNLQFTESDVKDQDALCVAVTVDIQPWTIVDDLDPVFKNN
ncbi:MAG: hypothetical protein IKY25_00910 [Alistipes sp.]|nr:hypothetical protein [Alistipes sp.]